MGSGLDWVRRSQILSDAEQRRLVRQAKAGDRRAADRVVRGFARAILAEANKYRGAADVEELFAVGIGGALEAVIKGYDAKRDEAVITYALATAKGLMKNEVSRQRKRDRRVRPLDLRDHGVPDHGAASRMGDMEDAQEAFVLDSRARFALRRVLDKMPAKPARLARMALLRRPALGQKAIAAKERVRPQYVSNVVRRVLREVRIELARIGVVSA